MTDLSDIYETRWPATGVTFAEPLASDRFADMFANAEKQQRLVNNAFAADQSREAAYDRRIAAVKAATGRELENPERGGYSLSERDLRRLTRDGPIDPMAYRRDQFEQQLAEIRSTNPDKAEALTFDDINAEAKATAKGAEDAGSRETGAGTIKSLGAELAGGVWGSRRDPLFVGSLFAGPTSALGKAAFTRIASSALFQGLYNAGLTAVEQPAVQQWRAEIGARSGVQPALENVGMSFLFGAIPGAAIQGVKEGLSAPLRRVLTGHPEPGDIEAVHAGLTPDAPREAAALVSGAESVAADRATLTIPEPKGVAPELHDDMLAAALKRADDPAAPSPDAVRALNEIEAYHGSPAKFEAFDSQHIGSGEGAQAYSYGHYVAENRAVAEGYAKKLSDGKEPQLYRVSIKRKPEEFLDWEADMDAQPAGRKILAEMDPKFKERLEEYLDDNGQPELETLTGQQFHRLLERWASEDEIPGVVSNYENPHFRREASEFIQKLGVPGVRFLDNKSRGMTEGGTRNYVVFNDKDLEITHRNNEARSRIDAEIEQRLTEAQPKSHAEAVQAADEALDDIGRREGMATLRESVDNVRAEQVAARAERVAAAEIEPPAKAPSKDPIGKVPWVDDEGRPKLLTAKAAAAVGEKDDLLAMLVRSCK